MKSISRRLPQAIRQSALAVLLALTACAEINAAERSQLASRITASKAEPDPARHLMGTVEGTDLDFWFRRMKTDPVRRRGIDPPLCSVFGVYLVLIFGARRRRNIHNSDKARNGPIRPTRNDEFTVR